MKTLSDPELTAIRATHGQSIELAEWDDIGAAVAIRPFTRETCGQFVDEATATTFAEAAQTAMYRHVVWPEPGDLMALHKRVANLPSLIMDTLCELGGKPYTPPGAVYRQRVDTQANPNVLAAAGVAQSQIDQLKTSNPDTRLELVFVKDIEGKVCFVGVLRPPGPAETAVVDKARKNGKGYYAACCSQAAGCLAWVANESFWDQLPCIAPFVLQAIVGELGGVAAVRRFRR
jgi:hypothetical protein